MIRFDKELRTLVSGEPTLLRLGRTPALQQTQQPFSRICQYFVVTEYTLRPILSCIQCLLRVQRLQMIARRHSVFCTRKLMLAATICTPQCPPRELSTIGFRASTIT